MKCVIENGVLTDIIDFLRAEVKYTDEDFYRNGKRKQDWQRDCAVIDIETDGLSCDKGNTDHILSVSALKIRYGVIAEHFFSYVAQEGQIPQEIAVLTGIKDCMVKDAPPVEEVLKKLCAFAKGCVICSHNLQFTLNFLNRYGESCGVDFSKFFTIDTLEIAKERLSGRVESFRLKTCCEYFNIPSYLDDATKTACLLLELAKI